MLVDWLCQVRLQTLQANQIQLYQEIILVTKPVRSLLNSKRCPKTGSVASVTTQIGFQPTLILCHLFVLDALWKHLSSLSWLIFHNQLLKFLIIESLRIIASAANGNVKVVGMKTSRLWTLISVIDVKEVGMQKTRVLLVKIMITLGCARGVLDWIQSLIGQEIRPRHVVSAVGQMCLQKKRLRRLKSNNYPKRLQRSAQPAKFMIWVKDKLIVTFACSEWPQNKSHNHN